MASSETQSTPPARRSRNAMREKLRRVDAPSHVKTFPTIPEPMEPLELPPPLLPKLTSDTANIQRRFEPRLLSIIFEQPEQEAEEADYRPWSEHHCESTNASSSGSTSYMYSCTSADYSTSLTNGGIMANEHQSSAPLEVIELQGELWEPVTRLQVVTGSVSSKRRRCQKRITTSFKSLYLRIARWSRSHSTSY